LIAIDLPADTPRRLDLVVHRWSGLLGVAPRELWAGRHYMAVLSSIDEVRTLTPDLAVSFPRIRSPE
jgi:hypothetical protein